MESWRIIATTLLGVSGLVLVLVTMAKVRDRTGSATSVAVSGVVALTLLGLLGLLTTTVLAAPLVWTLVIVVGAAASVMLLVG
ncbi:hypothetical protein V5P93_000290 [Actinokineospora auranticolor]|uniref:Uncharacterized protein n=1 Tax=Actinokineospora auranticolor TaxID=155976 RepID=A0A2S6GKQ7_9PSEU|nr:hypothetical protein [Actinokineospora auranticolor]PPK65822.1 hypothetical protein CLV40_11283 [Actinokineospora auranticolor]